MSTIKVLGLGNVLMGDDGVGPYVIKVLEALYACPKDVSFVEVGTPGLDLIPFIDDADVLLVVDTVRSSSLPGEIRLYDGDTLWARPVPPRLSPHDPGLKEALATLKFAGGGPREVLLIGIVPERVATGIGLSPAVRDAVPAVVKTVARELARRNARLLRRVPRRTPDIWWERPVEPACTR